MDCWNIFAKLVESRNVLHHVQPIIFENDARSVICARKAIWLILLNLLERGNESDLYPYPPYNAWDKISNETALVELKALQQLSLIHI